MPLASSRLSQLNKVGSPEHRQSSSLSASPPPASLTGTTASTEGCGEPSGQCRIFGAAETQLASLPVELPPAPPPASLPLLAHQDAPQVRKKTKRARNPWNPAATKGKQFLATTNFQFTDFQADHLKKFFADVGYFLSAIRQMMSDQFFKVFCWSRNVAYSCVALRTLAIAIERHLQNI